MNAPPQPQLIGTRLGAYEIQTPPPPLPARPDMPPEVGTVVQPALAKDPAVRFGTAGELANALARAWAACQHSRGRPHMEIFLAATHPVNRPMGLRPFAR